RADIEDLAVLDQHGARRVEAGGGVEQAGADIGGALAGPARPSSGRPPIWPDRLGRCWASSSRQAMRTATPISTCSRMTERW
ncbi:hypothetical protein ABTG32_18300, partial [Acinetobacter baumannii]